jgi:YihY family inner membrane protein
MIAERSVGSPTATVGVNIANSLCLLCQNRTEHFFRCVLTGFGTIGRASGSAGDGAEWHCRMSIDSATRGSRRPETRREDQPIKSAPRLSGDLLLMAALIGVGRALFGTGKPNLVQHETVSASSHDARGRSAEAPSEIPAKGWMDIAWRVLEGFQSDRVMLVAAGVTFYALLALFPATAAVVSLYGLFTDASIITNHLGLLSGFLPVGAVEVVGDQVKLLTAQGQGTLGFAFVGTLALSLWGANAATKAIFDALNIIYKEREKRSFIQLTLRSLAFTLGGLVLVLLAIGGIVIVPVAFKVIGIPEGSAASLLSLLRWPLLFAAILFALACLYRFGPSRERPQWRWVTWASGWSAPCCCRGMWRTSAAITRPMARWGRSSASWCGCGCPRSSFWPAPRSMLKASTRRQKTAR